MILKNTLDELLLEYDGTGETIPFTIDRFNSRQSSALFVLNADIGNAIIWQKIEGETSFRQLQSIDFSISKGNQLNNYAMSRSCVYKITYENVLNMSILVDFARGV